MGLAAISYDSVEILKHFSNRRKIRFPLLSDPDSKIIRAFGIFNEAVPASNAFYGIPHPVTFVTGRNGVVKRKYFEQDYRERQTLAGLLAKDYNVAPGAARETPQAKHVKLTTTASTASVRAGQRILLAVEVEMPRGFHVYAPGTEGYVAIDWSMNSSDGWKAHAVSYPKSRILYLKAIEEKVPVYEGKLRLFRDITIGPEKALRPVLTPNNELAVEGMLRYQTCDDRICYPPENVPLKWTLAVDRHDSERAPPELRRQVRP